MAKAIAKCKCSTCGAEFEKTAIRPNRAQADSWAEWAVATFDTCPDCYKKGLEEESRQCAEKAKEEGYPELHGTEKQISWAERIRTKKLEEIGELIEKARAESPNATAEQNEALDIVFDYIMAQDSASWWIDNRDHEAMTIFRSCVKDAQKAHSEQEVKEVVTEDEPTEDAVITPENAQFGKATIKITEDSVQAIYPKDDTFRATMKDGGFSWDSDSRCWSKKITAFTGTAIDRAADIANRLLMAGFAVECDSEEARQKAVDGTYEPECKRWIKCQTEGTHKGWLSINLPKAYNDPEAQTIYDASRKITGNKYSSGRVLVPVAQHDQVEDFASIYGFRLSQGALRAVEEYKGIHTVQPSRPQETAREDELGAILESSNEILPDLRD